MIRLALLALVLVGCEDVPDFETKARARMAQLVPGSHAATHCERACNRASCWYLCDAKVGARVYTLRCNDGCVLTGMQELPDGEQ